MPNSTPATPLAFEVCSAHDVLRFSIGYESSSNHLIICSDRSAFLQDLLNVLHQPTQQEDQAHDLQAKLDLLRPTLNNLQASRNVELAFCPDLATLQAHLSMLLHKPQLNPPLNTPKDSDQARPLLMIVNPIRVHEVTSSFSVQGFNRTFAAAVETAHHLGQQLIMVECVGPRNTEIDIDEEMEIPGGHLRDSPWDQQLSILNVTTKTFGTGERGWVGRTVKIRQVAERWCKFGRLEDGMSEIQK